MPESGIWRVDPGRGWLLVVGRQHGAAEGKGSMARKVGGESLGHQGSGAPLLSGAQLAGLPWWHPSPPAGPTTLGSGTGAHLIGLTLPSSQGLPHLLRPC